MARFDYDGFLEKLNDEFASANKWLAENGGKPVEDSLDVDPTELNKQIGKDALAGAGGQTEMLEPTAA